MRLLLLILIVVSSTGRADSPDWTLYNEILEVHVRPGNKDGLSVNLVDYDGLATSAEFEQLVRDIRAFPQDTLASREEKMAFFINAYNILTIQVILDHWPTESIRDIGGWFSNAWDLPVLSVDAQEKSLDDIEHRILRPLGESGIHFALNCASVSCPNLRLEAYQADRLSEQLDDQARTFLQQVDKGARLEGRVLHLSKIFAWYDDDFKSDGGVAEFIRRLGLDLGFEKVRTDIGYNWALNVDPADHSDS